MVPNQGMSTVQHHRNPLTGTRSLQSQQSCSSLPVHTLTCLPSTSSVVDVHDTGKPQSMCKKFLKTSSLDDYSTDRRPISTVTELKNQMTGHSMASRQSTNRTDNSMEIVEVIGPEGHFINPSDEYMIMTAHQQLPIAQRILNFVKLAWHEMTSNESIGSSEEG